MGFSTLRWDKVRSYRGPVQSSGKKPDAPSDDAPAPGSGPVIRSDPPDLGSGQFPRGRPSSAKWSMAMPAVVSGIVPAAPAPGSSPFHAKGLVYLGVRECLDRTVKGGHAAAIAAAGGEDGAVGRFLQGPFVAGSLYDALPLLPLIASAARLRGVTPGRIARELASHLASRDLRGVYKAVLALPSLEAVALRLPDLTIRYFDFGDVLARKEGAQTVHVRRIGVPDVLAPFLAAFVDGYTPVGLGLAGAVDVRITMAEVRFESMAARYPTVRLEYTISWT